MDEQKMTLDEFGITIHVEYRPQTDSYLVNGRRGNYSYTMELPGRVVEDSVKPVLEIVRAEMIRQLVDKKPSEG